MNQTVRLPAVRIILLLTCCSAVEAISLHFKSAKKGPGPSFQLPLKGSSLTRPGM